jgi:uncharacterized protein (DUF2147 family)
MPSPIKTLAAAIAAISFAALPATAGAGSRQAGSLEGDWRNPEGSVQVRIDTCGATLCGTVVAASPGAIADARDSGYPALIGMQLMHDYHAAGRGRWQGTIFVPDIGRSFSSHIDLVDAQHVRVSGCLLGKFLCKSQLWRRA